MVLSRTLRSPAVFDTQITGQFYRAAEIEEMIGFHEKYRVETSD
jgi:hypothetical protein